MEKIKDVKQTFSFGKYKGEIVLDVIYKDPQYFNKIKHLCSVEVLNIVGEINTIPFYVS